MTTVQLQPKIMQFNDLFIYLNYEKNNRLFLTNYLL